jgi:large subunit ribosomal protein L29
VRELSEEVFNLRFQLAMGVAKNPARVGQARRDLARAYTIIRERGGTPAVVAPGLPASPAPRRRAPAGRRARTTRRPPSAKTKKAKG